MRLLVVSNVPLDPALGSGYVITGYVDRLRARGHLVATLEPRDYVPWPRMRGAKRLRTLWGYTRATLRAVRENSCDVVELWGAESWRAMQRLAPRSPRPLLVARSNGLEPHFAVELARHGLAEPASLAGYLLDRWQQQEEAFRRADLLTTCSEFDAAFATAHRYQPAERHLTLPNPLPDEWLGQTFDPERPRVLAYFGAWLPNKGSTLLPTVLGNALRAHPTWRARLVGPAPEVAAKFPADVRARVEFAGHVRDKSRLRALYRESAVVLMPSAYESFGLVAAEALACGCALVASPVGFPASLRDGEEAVLVRERSVAAWTAALDRAQRDESQRRLLAAAGHARVQSLRWSDAIARLENFYARWLALPPCAS